MSYQFRACSLWMAVAACALSSHAMEIESTRCEHLRTPHGIDAAQPQLSWTLRSNKHGDLQTAYQLLVATSPDLLAPGKADAWDSGKTTSKKQSLVTYAGRELASHEHLYWTVRVWDRDGSPSDWSEPSEWIMGVLEPEQWGGDWIGLSVPDRESFLKGAQWIWFPEGDPKQSAAPGRRYFRRAFTIKDETLKHAVLRITGDDQVQINLNGRDLGSRSGPNSTKELDLTQLLLPGRNVLAVRGENRGESPSPAGVIARLEVDYVDGSTQAVASGSGWLAAKEENQGWEMPNFDDSDWAPVKVLGEVGCHPWGDVRYAEDRRLAARHLRREVEIDKPIERAVVSWCGLGCSELFVNGSRVGDQVLSPAMTQYPKRAYYITRDITSQLRTGNNALAVVLGNGRFYSPRSEVYAAMVNYGSPMLLLRVTVEHPNGETTVLTSDETWRLTDEGPIVANNEYDGEEYDARLELGDWRSVGYDDSGWPRASVLDSPTERLQAEPIAPMRVTERVKPVSLSEPKPGVFVFDLGQNIVGWCRLKVDGPAGTTIRLRHAERLKESGELYLANLRGAKATDRYTLRGGGPEEWAPRFTLHGFRYVEVTGYPGKPTLETITGEVVHDDLEPVGTFECADEVVNQVYRNARWGFRGNYRTTPLDCPQRDERQGWLGDRLETARSESYVFNVAAFYQKWLRDIRDSQKPSGSLPDIAPIHWPRFSDNVVWPSASVLLPGILYEQYGDLRAIRDQYECNARWIEHMLRYMGDDGLIDRDSYGDWCVPPESPELIHSKDPSRITDTKFLASAFLYYDLKLMQRYAGMLERQSDSVEFAALAQRLKEAINSTYYNPDSHQYSNGTQSSSVLPLAFGLEPDGEHNLLAATLADHVGNRDGGAIATGLVGGQFLCRTLTSTGRPDLAFGIAAREAYPSWGYMASQGATTIWELWNGDTADPAMNSGNHVMLVGDMVTWLYEDLAGIAADPAAPGFERILMKPQPIAGLAWAKASLNSPRGRIESHWRRDGDKLSWNISVPPGATAEAHLPTPDASAATIDGKPLHKADGVTPLGLAHGRVAVELASGEYEVIVSGESSPR